MKVKVKDSYEEMCIHAANIIKEQMKKKPNIVLGLATGSTPIGVYEQLVKMYQEGEISFENVKTFNLDEYLGLHNDHPLSYHYYMNEHLFSKVNINPLNTFIPSGDVSSWENNCKEYEKLISKHGPIDIQLLGIGDNCHIGFNEPGSSFDSITRRVKLTNSTIEANSRFFEKREDVPEYAVSMGIKTIMKAKSIILLANGRSKEDAIDKTINSEPSEDIPSSVLQNHKDVNIVIDKLASKALKNL